MASLVERETIINFNASDKTLNIWSCDPSWITKIKKLPGAHKSEQDSGWEADLPKAWLRINKPREVTVSQREAARKRMKKLNETKKG